MLWPLIFPAREDQGVEGKEGVNFKVFKENPLCNDLTEDCRYIISSMLIERAAPPSMIIFLRH